MLWWQTRLRLDMPVWSMTTPWHARDGVDACWERAGVRQLLFAWRALHLGSLSKPAARAPGLSKTRVEGM